MKTIILVGLATAMITACNPSTQNQKEMATQKIKTGMVEIITFKLKKGVSTEDFKNSALTLEKEFLGKQSGYVKRTLTVFQDSLWTDVVYWQDQQSQENTMKLAETSDLVLPFEEKIDLNSVKMNATTPILIEE